jgi:hypothetical protein
MADERAPVPAFAPASSATAAYEALWARVESCLFTTGRGPEHGGRPSTKNNASWQGG